MGNCKADLGTKAPALLPPVRPLQAHRMGENRVQEIVRGGAIAGHGAAATKQPCRN
jgi:hypothetical protein